MQITHAEAHKLIQFNADGALNAQEKLLLSTHLQDCVECHTYAEEIKEVENILLPVMKSQWSRQPIPLALDILRVKMTLKIEAAIILATRMTTMGAVFLALIFSAWQFTVPGGQKPSQSPVGIPPVPTPSVQSTSTRIIAENCAGILYRVQENETLESITQQFLLSKEEIMAINDLKTEKVIPGMELMIPICSFTPTNTMHPTFLSTKYTPSTRPMTSTPGG